MAAEGGRSEAALAALGPQRPRAFFSICRSAARYNRNLLCRFSASGCRQLCLALPSTRVNLVIGATYLHFAAVATQ